MLDSERSRTFLFSRAVPMHLMITAGPNQGTRHALTDGDVLVFGRGQDASARLDDPHASRKHCQVSVDGGKVKVKDLASTGGTFVGGKQIQETELHPGDVIKLGTTEIRFLLDGADSASTLAPTPEKREAPVEDLSKYLGKTIHNYRIDRELAKGNSGVVFLATHVERNHPLAVKILSKEFSQDDENRQRFVRAMKTMHPIQHPNIIHVFNAGQHEGRCWYSMEYVDGESLAKVIERIGTAGMLDWRTSYRVAVHIGRALEAASNAKIVHRNITPQNILIRSSDKMAKLGDLLLAKALEGANSAQVTSPGRLVGDLAYMSPERTRGDSDIDCRSDLYGLGATLYALLTGRPPFEGKAIPQLISKIRSETPKPPSEFQLSINPMFNDLVKRLLEKRPEDRYQAPELMMKDLKRIGNFAGINVD